jgi:hypothetical protein
VVVARSARRLRARSLPRQPAARPDLAFGAISRHLRQRFRRRDSRLRRPRPGKLDHARNDRLGHAHSVEAWVGAELAGGIYGLALGGFFAGESMFTRLRDGSKVALAHLVETLRTRGFQLFDIQMLTAHTASLGAIEIPRREYLGRLKRALACDVSFR